MKLLIIGIIILIAYLMIRKKFNFFESSDTDAKSLKSGFQLIEAPAALIRSTLKKTISNVVIGLVLILITILLFVKIKIVLFLLPIAFFLIGYFFLFNNHFSKIKSQQIWFNAKTNEVFVEQLRAENYAFNIFQDVLAVQKIESIQTTRGLLYGYYRIKLKDQLLEIPYLLAENKPANNLFFETLVQNFKIETQKRIFPII
ncbi:MAG: hypothetical protein K0R59_4022 [Sphingobacterium sp.]|jgi:hypothetical protein|uniref:hypothetical protein n=1 Tax=unclassified Sphingobacterium TaxID=2609468 RepID=UPI0009850D5E|nr:hypothetical protein [Sphingobacterium sp. CZ-UAM]MDF2518726.1 hypothetical protein [Sphingobacterium sp.]OOG19833.1 hypothetical protein BWD42_08020 [Sphingobacterium sp. CZ-UAM]